MQEMKETWVRSLGQEDPLEKGMVTHSSIPSEKKSHGQRILTGYSPLGHKRSDMTERAHTHAHQTTTKHEKLVTILKQFNCYTHNFFEDNVILPPSCLSMNSLVMKLLTKITLI